MLDGFKSIIWRRGLETITELECLRKGKTCSTFLCSKQTVPLEATKFNEFRSGDRRKKLLYDSTAPLRIITLKRAKTLRLLTRWRQTRDARSTATDTRNRGAFTPRLSHLSSWENTLNNFHTVYDVYWHRMNGRDERHKSDAGDKTLTLWQYLKLDEKKGWLRRRNDLMFVRTGWRVEVEERVAVAVRVFASADCKL